MKEVINIYTLSHPDTKEIFYVGNTAKIKERLNSHRKTFGFTPVIEVVETIECLRAEIFKIERYWIQQFKAWGFKVINVVGVKKGRGRRLYTIKQLAEEFQVSVKVAERLMVTNNVPCIKIGKFERYNVVDINAYIERVTFRPIN